MPFCLFKSFLVSLFFCYSLHSFWNLWYETKSGLPSIAFFIRMVLLMVRENSRCKFLFWLVKSMWLFEELHPLHVCKCIRTLREKCIYCFYLHYIRWWCWLLKIPKEIALHLIGSSKVKKETIKNIISLTIAEYVQKVNLTPISLDYY